MNENDSSMNNNLTDKNIKENDQNQESSSKFDPFEKYPFYEIKPIKWNPPSPYFHHKKEVPPPEEYVPPPKTPAREVDPSKLSDKQKKLAGMNLYEKDLEIIKDKNNFIKKSRKPVRASSVSRTRDPPDIFYREERSRQKKNMEIEKHEKDLIRKRRKQKRKEDRIYNREKMRIDRIAEELENMRKEQQIMNEEARQNEIKRRNEYCKSLQKNINPEKKTRASLLKEEATKKRLEKIQIDQNREKLNKKLRTQDHKLKTMKINMAIEEMNGKFSKTYDEKKLHEKKVLLRKKERQWMKWLTLTEQSNKERETMIERIYGHLG